MVEQLDYCPRCGSIKIDVVVDTDNDDDMETYVTTYGTTTYEIYCSTCKFACQLIKTEKPVYE